MTSYFLVCTSALDDQALAAARKAARSHGTPAQVPKVAQALLGWRYAAERKTARVPKRRPLVHSKAREPLAAAKG